MVMADLNGDGFDDLIIAEPDHDGNATNSGRVMVHYGSTTGVGSTSNVTFSGETADGWFGMGLAVGDFNGDGFDDLAIGSPGWNETSSDLTNATGMVEVFLGNSSGIETDSWWNFSGEAGEQMGWLLSTSESMNGDSMADLIVQARGYAEDITQTKTIHGKILIFKGLDLHLVMR